MLLSSVRPRHTTALTVQSYFDPFEFNVISVEHVYPPEIVLLAVRAELVCFPCGSPALLPSLPKSQLWSEFLVEPIRKVSVTNAFYDVALLYYARKKGARIREASVVYKHVDGSSFEPFLLTIGMGVSLVAFSVTHSRFAAYIPNAMKRLYYKKIIMP